MAGTRRGPSRNTRARRASPPPTESDSIHPEDTNESKKRVSAYRRLIQAAYDLGRLGSKVVVFDAPGGNPRLFGDGRYCAALARLGLRQLRAELKEANNMAPQYVFCMPQFKRKDLSTLPLKTLQKIVLNMLQVVLFPQFNLFRSRADGARSPLPWWPQGVPFSSKCTDSVANCLAIHESCTAYFNHLDNHLLSHGGLANCGEETTRLLACPVLRNEPWAKARTATATAPAPTPLATAVPSPPQHPLATAVPAPPPHPLATAVPAPLQHSLATAVPAPPQHSLATAVPAPPQHPVATAVPAPPTAAPPPATGSHQCLSKSARRRNDSRSHSRSRSRSRRHTRRSRSRTRSSSRSRHPRRIRSRTRSRSRSRRHSRRSRSRTRTRSRSRRHSRRSRSRSRRHHLRRRSRSPSHQHFVPDNPPSQTSLPSPPPPSAAPPSSQANLPPPPPPNAAPPSQPAVIPRPRPTGFRAATSTEIASLPSTSSHLGQASAPPATSPVTFDQGYYVITTTSSGRVLSSRELVSHRDALAHQGLGEQIFLRRRDGQKWKYAKVRL